MPIHGYELAHPFYDVCISPRQEVRTHPLPESLQPLAPPLLLTSGIPVYTTLTWVPVCWWQALSFFHFPWIFRSTHTPSLVRGHWISIFLSLEGQDLKAYLEGEQVAWPAALSVPHYIFPSTLTMTCESTKICVSAVSVSYPIAMAPIVCSLVYRRHCFLKPAEQYFLSPLFY